MEIREGYKKTEIGVIPVDWEVKKIGFITNVDPDNLGSSTNPNYSFMYISLEDVDNGILRNISELTFKNAPSRARRKVKKNDVLVSTVRPNLKSHLLINKNVTDWICSTGFAVLRCKENKTHSGFLFNHFFAFIINKQIDNLITGSNYPAISNKEVKALQIPLPPLPEQKAIAEVLSDTDELIQTMEKQIAKKRMIKQGAMQKLLSPKDDSSSDESTAYKWEVKKLGELIFSFQNGYGFSSSGYVNDGTPIVTMAQIGLDGSFKFNENKVNYWQTKDYNLLKSFHLKNGDVIIAMTDVTPEKNLIGRMTIVKSNRTLLLNQRVGHLRIDKSKVNPIFLTALSNMRKWRDYSISSASLGVQANISTRNILKGKIDLPPIEEQIRIATILSDMDSEIEMLENKLAKYKKLKQGMMQELLTGKIRLIVN